MHVLTTVHFAIYVAHTKSLPLFVFSSGGLKQNAGSLLKPVCDTFFIRFHMVALRLPSIVVLMTAYFKD